MRHVNVSRVCAVIPTYDRRDLLLAALAGLESQTRALDCVVVVDNASTDGTTEAVRRDFPSVVLLELDRNTGSAGGFARGIDWAYREGYEWIWLLDNDSVPMPSALDELLAAVGRFDDEPSPVLLASKVVWTDGSLLPMNIPTVKRRDAALLYRAAEHATVSMRYAPYAGVMIHRAAVERHGLPIESYFLYDDDTEYTGRLLAAEFGVLVPKSIVRHDTPVKLASQVESGPRFYYAIRNKLWLSLHGRGWSLEERLAFIVRLCQQTVQFLHHSHWRPRALWLVLKAVARGVATRPGCPKLVQTVGG